MTLFSDLHARLRRPASPNPWRGVPTVDLLRKQLRAEQQRVERLKTDNAQLRKDAIGAADLIVTLQVDFRRAQRFGRELVLYLEESLPQDEANAVVARCAAKAWPPQVAS